MKSPHPSRMRTFFVPGSVGGIRLGAHAPAAQLVDGALHGVTAVVPGLVVVAVVKLAAEPGNVLLHAVSCPVLVVQSHADETITPDSAEVILSGISSERKGVLWLEDAPHVCTITREAGNIADAIADHFRRAEEE